ncbi:inorganic polyphosphate/ATP-NAD kinase [Mycobacterium kansasii]|uniref:Inorganic polyphosphate/ATP-NAD kinase n=1 Tax=Mycobacterium kansasii TaxID=1768 RepID=A0A1V3WAW4_MYCKA|nr:inorganic polyphosphate/ATP-NAD kinase [Mycobacterium kansasii]OOK77238.1 inorganic polyphosphate/ATP-NAD kinase [Mycobacterium kansasii]
MTSQQSTERTVLLVVHTGRDEATETARRVEKVLGDNKIGLRVLSAEAVNRGSLRLAPDDMRARGVQIEVVNADPHAADGCELVLVLGGDGTFLRAAELARNASIPVLGVNLGRIGFLAEAEAEAIDLVLEHVVARDYRVEDRLTLDVAVRHGGRVIDQGWALNEASLEKGPRLGVLGWSSKSTAVRCRLSAATGCWCRRRPGPPPMRSRRAARCCGRISRRSWWCPTTLTRCSAGRWSPVRMPASRSR